MARPTAITPTVLKKLLAAIRVGSTIEAACGYAGIGESTYYDHMKADPELSEKVKEAQGARQVFWLTKIEAAAQGGTWQAAAWKLERLYPHIYGKSVQEMQMTGKDGEPMEFIGLMVPLPERQDDTEDADA